METGLERTTLFFDSLNCDTSVAREGQFREGPALVKAKREALELRPASEPADTDR